MIGLFRESLSESNFYAKEVEALLKEEEPEKEHNEHKREEEEKVTKKT